MKTTSESLEKNQAPSATSVINATRIANANQKNLIEEIAKILYSHEFGCTDSEYKESFGIERKGWIPPEGCDWPGKYDDFLCEWERDDYRYQAKKVLEFLA